MSADIKAMEERLERKYVPVSDLSGDGVGVDPDCAEAVATLRVLRANLRIAIAERDEALADAKAWKDAAFLSDCEAHSGQLDEMTTRAEAAEARLEELTRERDVERRHAEDGETLRLEEKRLRQAAEARLEEAKAVLGRITEHRMQDDTVLEAVRGLSIVQEMARAFLHQGGSE